MSLTSAARSYTRQLSARAPGRGIHRHHVTLLNGRELSLGGRAGLPTLIVNTASRCPFAPQLHGLQYLYESYRCDGLEVIACPTAEFGGLEHEDPAEIARVYTEVFELALPVAEAMRVRFDPCALWRDLASQPGSGAPVWNFNKYLIDGEGRVRGWWSTNVRPHHPRIREAIERELGLSA